MSANSKSLKRTRQLTKTSSLDGQHSISQKALMQMQKLIKRTLRVLSRGRNARVSLGLIKRTPRGRNARGHQGEETQEDTMMFSSYYALHCFHLIARQILGIHRDA